jgi:hypothetical protein
MLVQLSELVGAVVWPEGPPRPPPSVLFLLLPPPLLLLQFLLLFLFRLPPLPPLGGWDSVEGGGLAAGAHRWCRTPSGQPEDPYYPCGSPPVADHPEL